MPEIEEEDISPEEAAQLRTLFEEMKKTIEEIHLKMQRINEKLEEMAEHFASAIREMKEKSKRPVTELIDGELEEMR